MMYYNSYLAHHGIKGQKWGVRRFQKKDGTRTVAGKQQLRTFNKTGKMSWGTSGRKTGKSTKLSAEEAAHRKKVARNVAIGLAATSAALAVGYGVYHNQRFNKDLVISGEDTLQRISDKSEKELYDNLYVAVTDRDKARYQMLFPKHLQMQTHNTTFDVKTIKANKDLKIASPKNGKKLFNEYKKVDKDFADSMRGYSYKYFNKHYVTLNKENPTNRAGKALVSKKAEAEKFAKYMNSKGYSGMVDMQDMLGNYSSEKPAIIFKAADVSVKSVSDISVYDAAPAQAAGQLKVDKILNNYKTVNTVIAAPGLAAAGLYAGSNRASNRNKKRAS